MIYFRRLLAVVAFVALILGTVSTASAAHNGNNQAGLAGTAAEPDASGQSIVNFRKGSGTFNGNVAVENLAPGMTYEFYVTGAGAGAAGKFICSGVANSAGSVRCSAQGVPLPGFTTAEVRDQNGTTVASGVFARRGNCRDPQQAGSQCEAPGHDH